MMDPLTDWYDAVGPGWRGILRKLSQRLQRYEVTADRVEQVKEKFGGLRVYLALWPSDSEPEKVNNSIRAKYAVEIATAQSWLTCEDCGTEHKVTTEATWPEERRGWIKTLCASCWKVRRATFANQRG